MFFQYAGIRVYYEQHGAGTRQVLLLHGWGCSTALWKPVTEALRAGARVTVLDFPGHGRSGRPPEPWNVRAFAAMVRALITSLALEGCDVIAHSFGGRVAIVLAAESPQLVGKLILTGCAGLRGEQSKADERRGAHYRALRRALDWLQASRVLGNLPRRAQDMLRRRYGSPDYNALDEEMRKTFVLVVNEDLRSCLPNIQSPTLLVWGDQDKETPLWMARLMKEQIPGADLVVYEGAGHFAYLERLPDFLRAADQFLMGGPA